MKKLLSILLWGAIAALGAAAFGLLALKRGETVRIDRPGASAIAAGPRVFVNL